MKAAFYEPTQEQLSRLSDGNWCCSFSGGKDSTSLVTWVEWLRRAGWLSIERPRLVSSDTTVEYTQLVGVTQSMLELLRGCGWECVVVTPKIHEKLYNRILGIGGTPIHPGIRNMRWCTRSTKIDPMDRWRKENAGGLSLTGLRLGESKMRDGKIKRRGCAAGGECGIPNPDETTYSPLLRWTTCNVLDWLSGFHGEGMNDVWPVTRRLVDLYAAKVSHNGFDFAEPEVSMARFGCIGCPAICAEPEPPKSVVARNGQSSPLNELYDVWFQARRRNNRCYREPKTVTGVAGYGPIKLAVRKQLFARVMDIQRRAGVVLVSQEDEAFIRDCWEKKVYPRGWSEADELTKPPELPLFETA